MINRQVVWIISTSKLLGNYNSRAATCRCTTIISTSKLLGNYNVDNFDTIASFIISTSKLLGNYNYARHLNKHTRDAANPLTDADIANIAEVVNDPDGYSIGEFKRGKQRVMLEKQLDNDHVAVVEVIKEGNALNVVTFYNRSFRVNDTANGSSRGDIRNVTDSPNEGIVANPPRIVKGERFKVNADTAELQSTINEMQESPKPRMTRALRQAIDDEIYLSHPQLFNEEMTNIQGNGADWGIPRIHVDDLRHYLGDLTEDIPVTYRRTSGKRDIDVIAQEMGYSEVDEFLNELQRAAEARRTVRENKQLLAELRRNPEIITKAQEKLAKQEQEMAAEVAAKRQQAVTEIDDLLRERRKYAEQADADSVAQIDETVELLRQEGGLKSSEIDAMRRDLIESIWSENKKGQGVEIVNTSGEYYSGKRISNDNPFYAGVYQEYGRKPTKKRFLPANFTISDIGISTL